MIMKRPECAIPNCTKDAHTMISGRLVCLECFMKIYNSKLDKEWEEILNVTSTTNSGN